MRLRCSAPDPALVDESICRIDVDVQHLWPIILFFTSGLQERLSLRGGEAVEGMRVFVLFTFGTYSRVCVSFPFLSFFFYVAICEVFALLPGSFFLSVGGRGLWEASILWGDQLSRGVGVVKAFAFGGIYAALGKQKVSYERSFALCASCLVVECGTGECDHQVPCHMYAGKFRSFCEWDIHARDVLGMHRSLRIS